VNDLAGWIIPANLTNSTGEILVKECDYYEYGTGYIYSTLDHGIGPVILSNLKNSSLSEIYANKSIATELAWNWFDLKNLLLSTDCPVVNTSLPVITNGSGTGNNITTTTNTTITTNVTNITVDSSFLNISANWT
jgi:hypothetical protein